MGKGLGHLGYQKKKGMTSRGKLKEVTEPFT